MRKNVILTLIYGVGLGIFTSLGQTYLPDPFTQLANSYSIWLLAAFACGMHMFRYRWALLSGAVIQYIALATYYLLIHLRFSDSGFNFSSNIIWLIGGTLAGPLAGMAGKLYANHTKWSTYAVSFIVGVIVSEALYQFLQLKYLGEGLVFMALGIIIATGLLWSYRSRLKAILLSMLTAIGAYMAYAYILTALFN